MSEVHSHLDAEDVKETFDMEGGGGGGAGGGSGGTGEEDGLLQTCREKKLFRITACKNRFRDGSEHFDEITCFRNISLNLEIGWVFRESLCVLLPVSHWQSENANTLICEVQIHLDSLMHMTHDVLGVCAHGSALKDKTRALEARRDYILYRDLHAC